MTDRGNPDPERNAGSGPDADAESTPDADTEPEPDSGSVGDVDALDGVEIDVADLDPPALVERLYAHLEATETLPVSTEASRWLGEAQAVVADALGGAPEAVVAKRVDQAVDLLESVDDTGNPEANEHVAAAVVLARELQDRL